MEGDYVANKLHYHYYYMELTADTRIHNI